MGNGTREIPGCLTCLIVLMLAISIGGYSLAETVPGTPSADIPNITYSEQNNVNGGQHASLTASSRIPENPVDASTQTGQTARGAARYKPDEILVKFKPLPEIPAPQRESRHASVHENAGGEPQKDFARSGLPDLQLVKLKKGVTVESAIESYSRSPDVAYAEPNYIVSLSPEASVPLSEAIAATGSPVDDPWFPLQWAMLNTGQAVNGITGTPGDDISAPDAWSVSTGSGSVVIAVIDTGVDLTHQDLSGNLWTNTGEVPDNGVDDDQNGYIDDVLGYDFYADDPVPGDENGHGTHCAGIIGAAGNNGKGIAGVDWNARIMAVRFLGPDGSGSMADAIEAIGYANRMGADIISISWGSTTPDPALEDVISQSDALVVCAAGNSGVDIGSSPFYPAAFDCDNLISVAATDQNDNLAVFSNYGANDVDIGAPGVNILSCTPGSSYGFMTGTSMATPFVAGVGGLIKSEYPSASPSEIKQRILAGSTRTSSLEGKVSSGGRLNAVGALGATGTTITDIPVTIPTTIAPDPQLPASDAPLLSPENPDFIEYSASSELLSTGQDSPGVGAGFRPSPVDKSAMTGQPLEFSQVRTFSYPTSYDLRSLNKVTPVKNQGNCGSCWAFATYGSLESVILTAENRDFSENNLKNTHGFNYGPCEGGNYDMATAYLVRWSGPINETDDPYIASSIDNSPPGLPTQKEVQEVLFIPARSGSLDNDNLKAAIMQYGAVSTAFYWNSAYLRAGNNYYFSGTASDNHGVTIAGWDDNREVPGAPGPGAFLIKNSWGSGWGDDGYFWISYYDTTVARQNMLVTAEPLETYDRIYQYDPLGWTAQLGYGTTTAWGANVFSAEGDEHLTAAGFYTVMPNTQYQVYIYKNPTNGPINPNGYITSESGAIAIPGYHTVQLGTPVELDPGDTFSVVVRLTTPGYNYPMALERPITGYSSGARASAGQSYISSSGSSWQDLASTYSNTNACIKAYSSQKSSTQGIIPSADFIGTPAEGVAPLSVSFVDASTGTPAAWTWDLNGDGTPDSISKTCSHVYVTPGLYSVSLNVSNDLGSDEELKTDYIRVLDAPPFPPGWTYRKLHTLAGSPSGNLTDYQVRFTVWNTPGTDSGENVYFGSHVKPDFSDLQFTTIENDPMNYWIESVNSSAAVVWVRVPSIPVSGTQMYLYYGNPDASSASNGEATFSFFDDFVGSSLDASKWSVSDSGTFSVVGGVAKVRSANNIDATLSTVNKVSSGSSAVRSSIQTTHAGTVSKTYEYFEPSRINDNNACIAMFTDPTASRSLKYFTSYRAAESLAPMPKWSEGVFHTTEALRTSDDITWTVDDASPVTLSSNYNANPGCVRFLANGPENTDAAVIRIDWVLVRQYIPDGPDHGVWGSEAVNAVPPTADFIADSVSGIAPATLRFTDRSTGSGLSSWNWSFGDGTYSNDQNPEHTYTATGLYTVSLSVANPYGSDTAIMPDYITITDSAPFLSGWSSRRSHSLTGSPSGDLTDYQVRFTVWNIQGTDSGENVYLGSDVKPDFSDLQFTTLENAPMSYWVQSVNISAAVIWVRVPSIPSSGTQLYLYSGNPDASSASNGDATFTFFDDFIGSSFDASKWSVSSSGSFSVADSVAKVRSANNIDAILSTVNKVSSGSSAVGASIQTSHAGIISKTYEYFEPSWINDNNECIAIFTDPTKGRALKYLTSYRGTSSLVPMTGWSETSFHLVEARRTAADVTWAVDDANIAVSSSNYNPNRGFIRFLANGPAGSSAAVIRIDWVYVRQFTPLEPSHGEWIK